MVSLREQVSLHGRENSSAYLTDPFFLDCRTSFRSWRLSKLKFVAFLSFLPVNILSRNFVSIRSYQASSTTSTSSIPSVDQPLTLIPILLSATHLSFSINIKVWSFKVEKKWERGGLKSGKIEIGRKTLKLDRRYVEGRSLHTLPLNPSLKCFLVSHFSVCSEGDTSFVSVPPSHFAPRA